MDVEIIFSLISSFLPLALIVGVVVAVQRGRTGDRDAGSSVQRVLIYGFLAVVVMLVATGVDDLASGIIEKLEGEDPSAPAWGVGRWWCVASTYPYDAPPFCYTTRRAIDAGLGVLSRSDGTRFFRGANCCLGVLFARHYWRQWF